MPVLKPIRIIVTNGHGTLEGLVANEMDKNLVNMRALGVHGTFSVTNNLQVENASISQVDRNAIIPGAKLR